LIGYELVEVTRTFRQGGGDVVALDALHFRIGPGETVAIKGPSGSGKSTLLHLLGGLDRPTHGCLRYEGEDLGSTSEAQLTKFRQLEFGFVFQQFHLIPTLTAQQQVEAALVAVGVSRSERRLRAMELLGRVGLTNRAHHLPGRLSGGEMQRVGIARALAN
jgi:putative ABC transport system ATP-binding protein